MSDAGTLAVRIDDAYVWRVSRRSIRRMSQGLSTELEPAIGDRYRVRELIGGGGMSSTYIVEEVALGRAHGSAEPEDVPARFKVHNSFQGDA